MTIATSNPEQINSTSQSSSPYIRPEYYSDPDFALREITHQWAEAASALSAFFHEFQWASEELPQENLLLLLGKLGIAMDEFKALAWLGHERGPVLACTLPPGPLLVRLLWTFAAIATPQPVGPSVTQSSL